MRIIKRGDEWWVEIFGSPVYFHYATWPEAVGRMDELLKRRK